MKYFIILCFDEVIALHALKRCSGNQKQELLHQNENQTRHLACKPQWHMLPTWNSHIHEINI